MGIEWRRTATRSVRAASYQCGPLSGATAESIEITGQPHSHSARAPAAKIAVGHIRVTRRPLPAADGDADGALRVWSVDGRDGTRRRGQASIAPVEPAPRALGGATAPAQP